MKKTRRGSPRLEPQRIYNYFCALMQQQPGELNLSREKDFSALVGHFIVPKRWEHWAKLTPVFRAWHVEIVTQWEKRSYVKRKRRSIADNLWQVLGRLYWNYAAWIILRGEYKARKQKAVPEYQIEKRLKEHYGYLPQVKRVGWLEEVKKISPLDLAYRDTAESLGLGADSVNADSGNSLRLMLSPGRLRKSPPASLIAVSMDSKKLLSRLQRISPFRQTAKDKALIRFIKAEAY